jgi:hypothetical protein
MGDVNTLVSVLVGAAMRQAAAFVLLASVGAALALTAAWALAGLLPRER